MTSQEKRLRVTEEKIKGLEGDFDYIADQCRLGRCSCRPALVGLAETLPEAALVGPPHPEAALVGPSSLELLGERRFLRLHLLAGAS